MVALWRRWLGSTAPIGLVIAVGATRGRALAGGAVEAELVGGVDK